MKRIIDFLASSLNYIDHKDFYAALIHVKLLKINISLSLVISVISTYLGLNIITLIAFGVASFLDLILELLQTRLKKGDHISAKNFGRFALRFFVWISIFFIINSMKNQYTEGIYYAFYEWLFNFVLVAVNMEILFSILEKLGKITGKSSNYLVKYINKKIEHLLGVGVEKID